MIINLELESDEKKMLLEVSATEYAQVHDLKLLVDDKLGVPIENQHISYAGVTLEDDAFLNTLGNGIVTIQV